MTKKLLRTSRITLLAFVLLSQPISLAQSTCVDCYKNMPVMGGHGPVSSLPPAFNPGFPAGSVEGNRRVITVRIDSSWDVNPSGTATPGQTNVNVWNATVSAVNQWNNARGTDGWPTGYYFVIDQNQNISSPSDIVIKRQAPTGGAGFAETLHGAQHEIRLDPRNGNLNNNQFQAADLRGRVAHELAHIIGVARITTSLCASIIAGTSDSVGNRTHNTVTGRDVDIVNQHFASNGTACNTNIGDANVTEEGCADNDGDGYGDGGDCIGADCNDSDPAITSCGSVGCDAQAQADCFGAYGMTWDPYTCRCYCDSGTGCSTPVLIDVEGDGFELTGVESGVPFDLDRDGAGEQLSWTAGGSDDAWLATDRNGNGLIDNGSELFGNYTEQPSPPAGEERNGFLALAEFDKPANGGNADGVVDRADAIFSSLRLWQDWNHDGVSQPSELNDLPALNVARLHLSYKESKRVDEHGNRFRYRAKVDDARGAKVNRWAWDVFLMRGQ